MKNRKLRSNKPLIIILLAALFLSILAGCSKPAVVEIPDGMVLPFGDDGKWVGSSSELDSAYIRYVLDSTPEYVISSDLIVKENADKFIELMNGFEKQLIFADMDTVERYAEVPPEAGLGTFSYYITMMIDDRHYLLSIFTGKDGANLYFSTYINIYTDNYYSIYRIGTADWESLESFFAGLVTIQTDMDAVEDNEEDYPAPEKPVIYLYPETEQDINVRLYFDGKLTATYPEYGTGWNVHAYPDGTLTNYVDGHEYSYLYWEGIANDRDWCDVSEGYCVPGDDTAAFLQKTLSELGLTPKEYNEFIVYWLPQMQNNPYNLISFQWDEYEAIAPLEISPAPDSMLRVFMLYKPLAEPACIKAPDTRSEFVRDGFTVVEWGGSKMP